ncbi:MAG: ROK family protein [Ilumatobacteraceae bacterium]
MSVPVAGCVVGVDLGGTHLRAVIAPPKGSFDPSATQLRVETPRSLDAFVECVAGVIDRAGGARVVTAIGVGIPGLVEGAVSRWVPNLPFLDGVDLTGLWPVATVAANDAQLSLLAESTTGAVAGQASAILLALGTGIGSAVLAEGRIVRGSSGGACSFGWACADQSDPGSDRHGWLERHASGSALDALADKLATGSIGTDLVAAARRNEPSALAAVQQAGAALGVALAGAVALLDPAAVVVSGGVTAAWDVLSMPVEVAMRRHLPPHLRAVPVVVGTHGAAAGIIGAVEAARRQPQWWELRR